MAEDPSKEPLSIDIEKYLNDRLIDQMNWFDRKSSWHQKMHKRYRRTEIVAGALIPFLLTFAEKSPVAHWVSSFLGVIIVIAGALDGLNKHAEIYVQYRASAEALKQEKYKFQTRSAPYNMADDKKRAGLLVRNTETILGQDLQQWQQALNNSQAPEPDEAAKPLPMA